MRYYLSMLLIYTLWLISASQAVAELQLKSAIGTQQPPILQGLTFYPEQPLKIDFLIRPETEEVPVVVFRKDIQRQIQYFLETLTVRDENLWVNLAPAETHRIMSDVLEKTQLGRDMLEQDLVLKQTTAELLSPKTTQGQKFWQQIYKSSQQNSIQNEIFGKVWIMPDEAEVYAKNENVLITNSALKVLIKETQRHRPLDDSHSQASVAHLGPPINDDKLLTSLLPVIEDKVNNFKEFAKLRHIYQAMILATWYKQNSRNSLLGHLYIDRNKVLPLSDENKIFKDDIYKNYFQHFQKGIASTIQEEYEPTAQTILTKHYLTGGKNFRLLKDQLSQTVTTIQTLPRLNAVPAQVVLIRDGVKQNDISSGKLQINQTTIHIAPDESMFPYTKLQSLALTAQVSPGKPIQTSGWPMENFLNVLNNPNIKTTILRLFNSDLIPFTAQAQDSTQLGLPIKPQSLILGLLPAGRQLTSDEIQSVTTAILKKADQLNLTSLAMTNIFNSPKLIEAEVWPRLVAIKEYLEDYPQTSLEGIHIIIYKPTYAELYRKTLQQLDAKLLVNGESVSLTDLDPRIVKESLLQFYLGLIPNQDERWINDIWTYAYERFNDTHNVIQVLFPTDKTGLFYGFEYFGDNHDRVIISQLSDDIIATWKSDTVTGRLLRRNMLYSLQMMLKFYGFEYTLTTDNQVQIVQSSNFIPQWLDIHNFQRITRILTSLTLVGLEQYAVIFFQALESFYSEHRESIDKSDSFPYWKNAVEPFIKTTSQPTLAEHMAYHEVRPPHQIESYGGIDFQSIPLRRDDKNGIVNLSPTPPLFLNHQSDRILGATVEIMTIDPARDISDRF